MKIEYFPQTDTLSILLLHDPGAIEGEDSGDPDVTLLFDGLNRIAEIVIDHASTRTDLDDIRRRVGFEEVAGSRH